jgi:hypothetical protein
LSLFSFSPAPLLTSPSIPLNALLLPIHFPHSLPRSLPLYRYLSSLSPLREGGRGRERERDGESARSVSAFLKPRRSQEFTVIGGGVSWCGLQRAMQCRSVRHPAPCARAGRRPPLIPDGLVVRSCKYIPIYVCMLYIHTPTGGWARQERSKPCAVGRQERLSVGVGSRF